MQYKTQYPCNTFYVFLLIVISNQFQVTDSSAIRCQVCIVIDYSVFVPVLFGRVRRGEASKAPAGNK